MKPEFDPSLQGGGHENGKQRDADLSMDGEGDDFEGDRNWAAILVLSAAILVAAAGVALLIWSLVS